MAEGNDDFRVSCKGWMPLSWCRQEQLSITPDRAAWLNQVNEKRLRTILDRESRSTSSPDIATLEALVIEVLHTVKQVPPARSVVLSAHQIQWTEPLESDLVANRGEEGLVRVYLDPELPFEVEFFSEVREVTRTDQGNRVQVALTYRSEDVLEIYEQLVFIYYRRAQRNNKAVAHHKGP